MHLPGHMRWRHYAVMTPIVVWLGLWVGACTVENPSHCANRSLDETCVQLYREQNPLCSLCEAANNGCVAIVEAGCRPDPVAGTDAGAGGTASSDATSSPGSSPSTLSDSGNSATTAGSGSADGPSTTAGGSGDTVDSTSDTGGSASATTATSDPGTSDTSGRGPECGNGVVEGSEECDGEAFDGQTCQSVMGPSFVQGMLACTGDCTIDAATCCVPDGGSCQSVADCCQATACTGLNGSKCSL